jgi:hypothetical protein
VQHQKFKTLLAGGGHHKRQDQGLGDGSTHVFQENAYHQFQHADRDHNGAPKQEGAPQDIAWLGILVAASEITDEQHGWQQRGQPAGDCDNHLASSV